MMDYDYPYIRAWGRILGSYSYYIMGEVQKARDDNAPADACYYSDTDKKWVCFADVKSERTREQLKELVK